MDIIRDGNLSRLYGILRDNPNAAAFVKTADVLNDREWLDQPDEAFADAHNREFPIIDPRHTAISVLYASKFGADESVWRNLRRAADIYAVDVSQFEVASTKVASASPVTYLLSEKGKYPIYGEMSVKQAEDYFLNYGHIMHDEARSEYGESLVKVAADLDVELQPETFRMTGKTVTDVPLARDMMFTRSYYTSSKEAQEAYMKVAEVLETAHIELSDNDTQAELVRVIRGIDKIAGLDRSYSVKIPTPESTVYNTVKLARPMFTMGPCSVTPEKLAMIDPDILGDIIGEDMVEAMSKQGELDFREASTLLSTLPRDIQNVVARTFRL